jgi:hypothetical protein
MSTCFVFISPSLFLALLKPLFFKFEIKYARCGHADHRVQPPSFEKEKTQKGMKYDRTTPVHPATVTTGAMCFKLLMLPCYICFEYLFFFKKRAIRTI